MAQSAGEVDARRFHIIALLQEAPRNQGQVELAQDTTTGQLVAVKAMPVSWVCQSHEEFVAAHPEENEQPWRDISVLYYLSNVAGLQYVCEFVALFRRQGAEGQWICMASSYCAGGDLFTWLERNAALDGSSRENMARSLLHQVLGAVRDIHGHGVAHGDLSLENVLLKDAEASNNEVPEIRVIDFGASTGPRAAGPRGKPSYQAPEVHTGLEYDAYAADAFSIGVMAFTLVVGNYPWKSTRPHIDKTFQYACEHGLPAYLERRKVSVGGNPVPLSVLLSAEFVSLVSGLLSVDFQTRLTVSAALDHPWFVAERS